MKLKGFKGAVKEVLLKPTLAAETSEQKTFKEKTKHQSEGLLHNIWRCNYNVAK